MAADDAEVADIIWRRLSATSELTEADRQPLLGLGYSVENFASRQMIAEEGSRPTRSCVILEGITSRYQYTREGERQIQAVQIIGDIPDILSLHLKVMDHSLRTLSACRLAFIPHDHIRAVCASSPSLAAAIWKETLIDAAIFRASILRIGKLDATERVAHLLCELKLRHETAGVLRGDSFILKMTQQEIGDLVALSFVSVNRAVRELREAGLVRMHKSRVTIDDWDGLVERGQFDATYLHQSPRQHEQDVSTHGKRCTNVDEVSARSETG